MRTLYLLGKERKGKTCYYTFTSIQKDGKEKMKKKPTIANLGGMVQWH